MRLSNREVDIIQEKVFDIFGDAVIDFFVKKMQIKTMLEDVLYKPVDIVIAKNQNRLIEKEALKGLKLAS